MYRGKYARKTRPSRILAWILIVVAALSAITGAVVAYLSYGTAGVENTFSPAQSVNPSVVETFDGKTKSNVYVNVGDTEYSVYVRAAVVITWKNSDGDVLGTAPVPEEYTIEYNTDDWFRGDDGFWYYTQAVPSGENTSALIVTCTPVEGENPEGYSLNVEIIAQTVQQLGSTDDGTQSAVMNAWGVDPEGDHS